MTYYARETAFLANAGFDDLLLAYPSVQRSAAQALAGIARSGKNVATVADDAGHLDVLEYGLVRGDAIERRVATYRGMGQCFLG